MSGDVLMKGHHARALVMVTTRDDVDVAALREGHTFADSHCHRLPPARLTGYICENSQTVSF